MLTGFWRGDRHIAVRHTPQGRFKAPNAFRRQKNLDSPPIATLEDDSSLPLRSILAVAFFLVADRGSAHIGCVMPFSATRDAENYWRTRYGLPPDADNDKILKDKAARDIGPSAKSASRKKRLINNAFPSPRRRRWRIWLAVSLFVLSGAAYVALQPDDRDAAPSGPERISARPGSADGRVEPDTAAADFDVALDEFSSAREASVVALRGYLLTEGEDSARNGSMRQSGSSRRRPHSKPIPRTGPMASGLSSSWKRSGFSQVFSRKNARSPPSPVR